MIDPYGVGPLALVIFLIIGAIYSMIKNAGAKEERDIHESRQRIELEEKRRISEAKQLAELERKRKISEMPQEKQELYQLRDIADFMKLRTPEALVEHHIQIGVWPPDYKEEGLTEIRKKWDDMQRLPEI